jgi:membrane-bound lytic murein transglycosylase MltF
MFMDYSYASQPAQQVQQPPVYVEDNSGLRDEVSRLADEVERLRNEQAQQRTPTPREASVPTTLVYRDGRRIEVQNYAVVGRTLWLFNESHAANEQRGVEVSF